VSELLSVVRSRAAAPADVRVAFLDHCAPSLPQVLGSLTPGPAARGRCVVVPLLLTAAYHSKTDIPAQLASSGAAAGLEISVSRTLGPHALLLAALERRLAGAGVRLSPADRAGTAVVLAAAGSSDPAANATIADLAAAWRRDRGWRDVVPAYASAAAPTPAEAVRSLHGAGAARVVVATYLLAPGYFAGKIRASALSAGAWAVSETLGAAPEVADVVLARYAAASRLDRLWSETNYAERTVATRQLVNCSIRGDQGGTDVRRVRRAAHTLTR